MNPSDRLSVLLPSARSVCLRAGGEVSQPPGKVVVWEITTKGKFIRVRATTAWEAFKSLPGEWRKYAYHELTMVMQKPAKAVVSKKPTKKRKR